MMTRRSVLLAGCGSAAAICHPVFAGGKFWNDKEPSAWSENEVDRILTNSPWANQASTQMNFSAMQDGGGAGPRGMGGRGMGGPGMGGPGMGGPGMGGPGMGGPGMGGPGMGGPPGAGEAPQIKALVRWESAAPIRAALKNSDAAQTGAFYVISVSGLPAIGAGRRMQGREGAPDGSPESRQQMQELMKQSTSLVPKGRAGISPTSIENLGDGKIFFYFTKEALPLSLNDKEVTFTTRLGPLEIKSKFNLKDMRYRGELAI